MTGRQVDVWQRTRGSDGRRTRGCVRSPCTDYARTYVWCVAKTGRDARAPGEVTAGIAHVRADALHTYTYTYIYIVAKCPHDPPIYPSPSYTPLCHTRSPHLLPFYTPPIATTMWLPAVSAMTSTPTFRGSPYLIIVRGTWVNEREYG